MHRLLVLLGLVVLQASARAPFKQTPAYLEQAFKVNQPSTARQGQAPLWRDLGPDRSTAKFADTRHNKGLFGLDPTPWGQSVDAGRVRTILQDPDNLNSVYVLFGGGGLWKTDNFYATPEGRPGGTTWKSLTDKLPNNGGSISFGANSNILYYGIGDFDDSLLPSNDVLTSVSGVIVKSTDGGATWGRPVIVDTTPGAEVSIIWDIDVILGAAPNGAADTVMVGTDLGLYISTNGGASFRRVLPANPENPNPLNNRFDFYSIMRTSAGWIVAGRLLGSDGDCGIFLSADGVTWGTTPTYTFTNGSRVSLWQAEHNDPQENVVLAVVEDRAKQDNWLDIFRSDDGGRSFQPLNILDPDAEKTFNGPPSAVNKQVLSCIGEQSSYNHAMIVDPADRDRHTFVWAGALGSFKTSNNGETVTLTSRWKPLTSGECPVVTSEVNYVHADAHAGIALKRPAGVVIPKHELPQTPAGVYIPHRDADADSEARHVDHPAAIQADTQRSRPPTARHTKRRHDWKEDHKDDEYKSAPPPKQKEYSSHAPEHERHFKARATKPDSEYDQPYYGVKDKPYPYPESEYHEYHREHAPYRRERPSHEEYSYERPYPDRYEDSHSKPDPYPDRYEDSYSKPDPYSDHEGHHPHMDVYDYLLGTDGGLFFSTDRGNTYDNGFQNIGIGTFLVTHIQGTPLSRDLLMLGAQDNGHRLRIGKTTAWEQLVTGDGQGQFLSQAGSTDKGGWMGIGNWYGNRQRAALDQLINTHREGDQSELEILNTIEGLGNNNERFLIGSFGIPDATMEPTGQVVFTRRGTTLALYRSGNAGADFSIVHNFPPPQGRGRQEEEEDEESVRLARFVPARLHNIGVAAGRDAGTLSVAVIRPLPSPDNTNSVDVTFVQGSERQDAWSSTSPATIPGWVEDRIRPNGAASPTTTSPAWQSNTRLFVSSVALPDPERVPPRPRIAFADVIEGAGGPVIGGFTKCEAVGLPDTPVPRILIDGNTMYAATWRGVYVSTDGCATFQEFGVGLPNVQVTDLYLLPQGDGQPAVLRAGTYGRGVWEVTLP